MQHRRGWITTAVLGTGLSLLLGSGLFAAVSDSVESTGNKARSGTSAAGAQDITVARVAFDPMSFGAEDCAGGTYGNGPLTALLNPSGGINVSLDNANFDGQTDVLCVRNSGATTGRIKVIFDNVVETEVGACETTESSAGDTTCSDAAAGELKSVLQPGFVERLGETGTCSALQTSFAGWEGAGQVLASSVAPGQICVWQLETHTDLTTTDTQRLRAQTDMVQWDITFVLEDVPA